VVDIGILPKAKQETYDREIQVDLIDSKPIVADNRKVSTLEKIVEEDEN